jgi:hypothetical protein
MEKAVTFSFLGLVVSLQHLLLAKHSIKPLGKRASLWGPKSSEFGSKRQYTNNWHKLSLWLLSIHMLLSKQIELQYNHRTVLVRFSLLWQILERNSLKEKGFSLTHGFRGFSPWLTDYIAWGPRQDRLSWWQKHGGAELLTSCWLGSRDSDRKGSRTRNNFPGLAPPVTYFL